MTVQDELSRINTLLLDMVQDIAVVQTQNAAILSEQTEARESRRLMHAKLEEIKSNASELKTRVDKITEETVPTVKKHDVAFNQAKGAWIVTVTAWSGFVAIIGALAEHYIRKWFG